MTEHQNREVLHNSASQETQPKLSAQERLAQSEHYVRAMSSARVLRSKEFALARNSKLSGAQAFGEAAAALAQSPEEIDDFDRSLLTTVSRLGTYMDAQREIDDINNVRDFEKQRGSDISQDDIERLAELKQEYMLPFNHAIKELILDNPALNAGELRDNLAVAYTAIYGRHNTLHPEQPTQEISRRPAEDVLYNIEAVINGMRHEVATETLFAAAGLNYDYNVTDEQDKHGRDIYAEVDGKWGGIDIKASFGKERKTHQRQRFSKAVWTGLTDADFRGPKDDTSDSVSISFATAKKYAPAFIDRIRKMRSGELGRQHRAAQNTGSRALQYHS